MVKMEKNTSDKIEKASIIHQIFFNGVKGRLGVKQNEINIPDKTEKED